jgi:hypothetical protein
MEDEKNEIKNKNAKNSIKRDAEEIKKEIQKYADRYDDAAGKLLFYNNDAYIKEYTLKELCYKAAEYDFEFSDYINELAEFLTDVNFVYDCYYDFEENNTSLDLLMQSKNKDEFLQYYKEYVADLEERAELQEDATYDNELVNIKGYELIKNDNYKYAVVIYTIAPCWAAYYISKIVLCITKEQAEDILDLITLEENIKREDISPVQEGRWFKRLMSKGITMRVNCALLS